MYLTALLLARRQAGTSDTAEVADFVNAWMHIHGEAPVPRDAAGNPDLSRIAELEPGRVVREHVALPPGGNAVLAYLDVAGPDETSPVALRAVLDALRAALDASLSPWTVYNGLVGARLGVSIGLEEAGRAQEVLERLSTAVSTLFEAAPTGPDSRPAPYLVWLRALPGGIELSLPPTTRSRIDATAASAARVLLGHDVMSDHPGGVRAAVQETALVLLTGVERDEVAALGLLFIDPETGATVLEVPAERTQVAETPPGDMPLVYLAGNAGVNFEIEKVPWDKLLEVDAARKWVVWGLIDDLDRVVAMTPEAVAEYVLPKPDPETSLMPPSWRGKTDSTEGSRGSRTQPFAGRSRFKRFVKSLDAFLALTGPELRLVRMRRREAELKLCTSDELRRLLRKRNRRGGTNAPRKS